MFLLKQYTSKKIDYIFLALLPVVATLVSLIFETNYLFTTFLFFGVGSIWFTFRAKPIKVLKSAIYTVLVAFPLGTVVLDYILVSDHAWWSPTIFPSRLLGILPWEDLIWGLFQGYFVVILYEYFFDKGKDKIVGKNFKYFIYFILFLLTVFFSAYFFEPTLLHIPYAYVWLGLVFFIIPSSIFMIRYPKTIPKILKLSAYFLVLHICFEFTALKLGNWTFPSSNYLAVVNIFGFLIPIEEIIIWWFFFIVSIISWYEFFDDDQK